MTIGLMLFPGLTQLDLTGPYEVFTRMPEAAVHLVAASREPVSSERGLDFLASQGQRAHYVTAVCTGSLLLGAGGLLRGYRATTHWLSLDLLPLFGAIPVAERVVIDRNRITGGGVTAGIDFALTIAAEVSGPARAQEIQLMIEYDPAPPFRSGSPRTAPPDVVSAVTASRGDMQARRRVIAERAAAALPPLR